ncbi:helix-turn-helix transcriptional regulator [Pseudorhodobacter sp. W20_MBD10_FR17]|uniref:helix-turn-helix transcriptional regulator n=1 Tax=Pseudorhodobacter sp. W20_MBD10_FR17 TaxID=3240266 RepID=UPI003F995309
MMVFPLPILTFLLATVAGALLWRVDFGQPRARHLFAGFFGIVAVGALLVGLRFGYGIHALIPLQRALPLFGGPLLYLGFASLTPAAKHQIPLHLGFAAGLAIAMQTFGWSLLDGTIAASYACYSAAILWLWRKGPNHLIHARLELAPSLHRWMLWAAGFLIAMLLIDTTIAVSFALRRNEEAVQIISYGSVGLIALMIAAIVTAGSLAQARPAPQAASPSDENQLEQAAHDFLIESQLYLDTGLTIERLAKRLHVPMRNLSAAINQSKGMNISQYVNGFRLDHAAKLLRESQTSVTDIATQSGFLTRSNFYREFQRRYGKSPAAYRQAPPDTHGPT